MLVGWRQSNGQSILGACFSLNLGFELLESFIKSHPGDELIGLIPFIGTLNAAGSHGTTVM